MWVYLRILALSAARARALCSLWQASHRLAFRLFFLRIPALSAARLRPMCLSF